MSKPPPADRRQDRHRTVQYSARLTPDLVKRTRGMAAICPGTISGIIAAYPAPADLLGLRAQLHRAKNLIHTQPANAPVVAHITHLLNAKRTRENDQYRVRLSRDLAARYQVLRTRGALALGLVLRAVEMRLTPSTLRHLATQLADTERGLGSRGVEATRAEYVSLFREILQLKS